jgi:hypothetical protein
MSALLMQIRMKGDNGLAEYFVQLRPPDIDRPVSPKRIIGQHLTPQTAQSAGQPLSDLTQTH